MPSLRHLLPALLLGVPALLLRAVPVGAQVARQPNAVADASETAVDDEGVRLGLQYGVASGALHYGSGRNEQALGAVLRWAPTHWFSLAATPAGARVSEPSSGTVAAVSRSGLTDMPVEATVTHAFASAHNPTLAAGFGVTLPLGDSAAGFGSGRLGSSVSAGLGFAPMEKMWAHLGTGRTLSGFAVQSAFGASSGWGDASAGYSLSDRVSVSGGYSTDIGAIDPTIGRSTSVTGGFELAVAGPTTLHFNASRGLSGLAPVWSLGLGFGTAFPYLNHLGDGSSMTLLRQTFGGGSHGLGSGTSGQGNGRGKP